MTNATETTTTIADMDDATLANALRAIAGQTVINKMVPEHAHTIVLRAMDFPMNAIESFLLHGMQRKINDKVGGGDITPEDKVKDAVAMVADFKAGIVSKARASGTPVNDVQKLARSMARKIIKTLYGSTDGADYKRDFIEKLDVAAQNEKLDALIKQRPVIMEDAEAEIAARANITGSVDLAELGL